MATGPGSGTSVVFDASALIRGLVDLQADARQWLARVPALDAAPAWPAHLYLEVAQVLVRLARAEIIDRRRAGRVFAQVRRVRAYVHPPESMETAMAFALERHRRLTVYDAAYVALAEALGAPLVTADRRLAEATPLAVLLPE